ncbi:MAG: [FeFe] hydrogenase H-cluster radical SAM maturase HydG [Bacteroidales bacterium]|nr:[FeFe] hydrogenase H-cluster radical SAM maturase HydG [Bacteroidales bacterium]
MTTSKQLSKNAVDFIDDEKLHRLINETREDLGRTREIVQKGVQKEALTLEDTAALLAVTSSDGVAELFESAKSLKKAIYGNRIVLFAPLYIGNYCVNNCTYCGFRKSLRSTVRRTLSDNELIAEVAQLQREGHKRLILVYGEHPHEYTPEFIAHTVKVCYGVKTEHGGEIRRVNINAAPLSVEGFKTVKEAGIGTFQIFQETYHKESYNKYHPINTVKGDYMWRLNAMNRAFEGGCDDVGLGALFGLYDWRFEVLGLVAHSLYLQQNYGVGPHTLSFPRIKAAHGVKVDSQYQVTDEQFKRLVAILRLAVPYTGLIMTARESPEVRDDVIEFGVSQIDAGTRLEIGSYQEPRGGEQELKREQFKIGDTRELDEVIRWLLQRDFIPSFCTSCYRLGRTGVHFMEYAIPGFIGKFCTPNALLTLAEYLEDYASPETKIAGYELINRELAIFPQGDFKSKIEQRIDQVKSGERDLLY